MLPLPEGGGYRMPTSPGAVYKRDFWANENTKYTRPHHRMLKVARLVNRLAAGRNCRLLDVGCGPATLGHLLDPNVEYYGIDIAIQEPVTEPDGMRHSARADQL